MKNTIFLFSLICVALFSCKGKDDTTPSFADTDRMESLVDRSIPRVKEVCDNYGTYLLYNFDKTLDFSYQFQQTPNWNDARLTMLCRDSAIVAVDYLCDNVFSCYNDDFKKQYLPRKMLLVGDIQSNNDLGLSHPDKFGNHAAVANMNSMTVAFNQTRLNAADVNKNETLNSTAFQRAIHRALLADYIVKSKNKIIVGNEFLEQSRAYYTSLMEPNRTMAKYLPDSLFVLHGFFRPYHGDDTYYPSSSDDVAQYIENLVNLDDDMTDSLMEYPLMANKMHYLAASLQALGVDVAKVNPNAHQFLIMTPVIPATIQADAVVTDTDEADLNIVVNPGSVELAYMTITVNDNRPIYVSLIGQKERLEVTKTVTGLVKGKNTVEITLFRMKKNKQVKAVATCTTFIRYASLDNVSGFRIDCDGDDEQIYRRINVRRGEGYPVSNNEEDPNLITISFEKHGVVNRYLEEEGGEYRAWKIYTEQGRAVRAMSYVRGFNENMTDVIYTLTDTYTYLYNSNGELTRVNHTDADNKTVTLVQNVAYKDGLIESYDYKGRSYTPQYKTADSFTARIDCLDEKMSGHCFGFTGSEELNPYYLPELPAVIPGFVCEIPLQLLYSQYVFQSLDGIWSDGWQNIKENDARALQAVVNMGGKVWRFTYVLNTSN